MQQRWSTKRATRPLGLLALLALLVLASAVPGMAHADAPYLLHLHQPLRTALGGRPTRAQDSAKGRRQLAGL
jgi:hypothetical protein